VLGKSCLDPFPFGREDDMAKGLALTIGLNAVDPRHYTGLLTRSPTRRAGLGGIARAAAALRSGDIFLLTYSGHGGQVPDRNHDEPDLQDETWCLYDGELLYGRSVLYLVSESFEGRKDAKDGEGTPILGMRKLLHRPGRLTMESIIKLIRKEKV
jgi:hypothetical protein